MYGCAKIYTLLKYPPPNKVGRREVDGQENEIQMAGAGRDGNKNEVPPNRTRGILDKFKSIFLYIQFKPETPIFLKILFYWANIMRNLIL